MSKEFHTWEEICLLKLQELGKITKKEWATAMGFNYTISLDKTIKNNRDKLNITQEAKRKPIYCEIRGDLSN